MSFGYILLKNIFGYDLIIFFAMIAALFFFIKSRQANKHLYSVLGEPCIKRKENGLKLEATRKLETASEAEIMEIRLKQDKLYGAFTTIISVFPLLGMIGTVYSLLRLDMTDTTGGNITDNFWVALTSTFWGAIFGVIFKLLDCSLNPLIEDANERYRIGIDRRTLDIIPDKEGVKNETE